MLLHPGYLYTSTERKKINVRLKNSKDLEWFRELLTKSNSVQLLYLSEPLTECIKSNKLHLNESLLELIVHSLDRNCQTVLKSAQSGYSSEDVAFLGVCCLGLNLFLKSVVSKTHNSNLLSTSTDQLTRFLLCSNQIPRDSLNLIIPFIIFLKENCHNCSFEALYNYGTQFFSGNQYLMANWNNCLLKICRFEKFDLDVVLKLLKESMRNVREKVVWYQFLFLDSIRKCLKKHRLSLELKEFVSDIFDLVTLFYDDRGLSVSKVCEDIVQTCLEIEPGLLHKIKGISQGPWYSRKTVSFLNIFLDKSQSMEDSFVFFVLESLISHLGYNRLDHCSIKAIQTLLNKHMAKENLVSLLEICVSCVEKKPAISRILSRHVTLFSGKPEIVPDDLREHVFKLIDAHDASDEGKIFLYEIFYSCFKQDLQPKLISSQLNKSSSSEVQSTLIMLISRNIKDFYGTDFLAVTFENLLTIPCPTVRLHTIASFQSLKSFAKLNSPSLSLLVDIFLKNIYLDASYHSLVTALNFFIVLQNYILTGHLTKSQTILLQNKILKLGEHSDTEISSLALKIQNVLNFDTGPLKSNNSNTVAAFSSLMKEAEKVTGLQNISQTDIPTKILEVKRAFGDLPVEKVVILTRVAVSLISKLLNMISHNDSDGCQFYSAPSFEETFVIIQAAISGDEAFCKKAGKSVWSAIASLLDLLNVASGVLVELTMEGYLTCGVMFVEDLYLIGDICLKCVFRCRHRSVINASCETLKAISIKTSPHPPTHQLSSRWVFDLLHVLYSPTSSSLSRRSAGLPEAIEALLQCNNINLTHKAVEKLLDTANIPYPEQSSETEDLVQVHSLHMLRVVLSSAKLRHHLIPFSDQICKLCYTGFIHPFWVVRNASFLLFAELVNYILGHLNTEFNCGYRSNLSIGELKQHYNGIYNQVLSNLKEHSNGTKTCPTIFLSLMISSKLYPDISDRDTILGGYLLNLLSSPIYKIRSVAARTLVLVSPRDAIKELVQKSIHDLDTMSQNKINGVLMFVLEAANCEGYLVECGWVEITTEKLKIDKMVDVNISLLLQIYINFYRPEITSDMMTKKVIEIKEKYKHRGYPGNVLDYLGIWYIVKRDYESVYAHIQCHCHELSEIFWNKLDKEFYRTLTLDKLIWFLDSLTKKKYHYVHEYLADFVFVVINEHFKSKLTIPSNILSLLSDNTAKYAHINMILAVNHDISTNDSSLVQTLHNNLRFDRNNARLLSYFYKIQNCRYNHVISSELLASALLHCQSENEEIRKLATRFCVLMSTGKSNVNVTAIHAMDCVVKYVRNFRDVEKQSVYISAINRVKEKVLANDDGGFDIHSNAHFDKELFLRLINF